MLSVMAVPSLVMRSASQGGTKPPCKGKSATPDRFTISIFFHVVQAGSLRRIVRGLAKFGDRWTAGLQSRGRSPDRLSCFLCFHSADDLSILQDQWFENEFWPFVWRKVDKADALKSFRKRARTVALKDKIVAAAKLYTSTYLLRDKEHRPH